MVFFVCLLLGIALPHRSGAELQVSGLFLQFMCVPLHVLLVLLCVVLGASLSFLEIFSVFFSPSLLSLYFTLFITMHHYVFFFFLFFF